MSATDRLTLDFVVPRIYAALPAGGADLSLGEEASPVSRELVSDLHVLYAFDCDTHYIMVAQRDLARLGIDADELHESALRNLRALNLEVRAHETGRVRLLTAGGNYEATLLLLPELWEAVAGMVSGHIVAVAPARDILLFTGDAETENLAELRRQTSVLIEKVEKPLSRTFVRWTGETWEKYEGFAG